MARVYRVNDRTGKRTLVGEYISEYMALDVAERLWMYHDCHTVVTVGDVDYAEYEL